MKVGAVFIHASNNYKHKYSGILVYKQFVLQF